MGEPPKNGDTLTARSSTSTKKTSLLDPTVTSTGGTATSKNSAKFTASSSSSLLQVSVDSLRKTILAHMFRESFQETNLLVYAFAYGSAVFEQKIEISTTTSATSNTTSSSQNQNQQQQPTSSQPLVDAILVVRDVRRFHQLNLQQNPQHYPIFTNLDSIHWIHTSFGLPHPCLYFIIHQGYKIGIVQLDHFLLDLNEWSYLYLAGRLHKPTLCFHSTNNHEDYDIITRALLQNQSAALATVLLQQQQQQPKATKATPLQLYKQIASLSYTGDFRMGIAEDPQKIDKLVNPNHLHYWDNLYKPTFQQFQSVLEWDATANTLHWDSTHPDSWTFLRSYLPRNLRKHLPFSSAPPTPSILRAVVGPPALGQSLKGLLTVSPGTSLSYAIRKITKRFKT